MDLDFYVEAAIRAKVGGAALGDDASQWSKALGDDCVEDVRKSRMRRDYGLIEIFFERRAATWRSTGFSLQIHRLTPGESVVPAALSHRYGKFRSQVNFEELHNAILRTGNDVVEWERAGEYRHYKIPQGNTSIYVADASDAALPVTSGVVWSINVHPSL
ncbi:hypothetical protein Stsp01_44460 [Streptomyces sp. NBRC 13847]|uniref:hypothetical protein n=1 Tax=Streptomyces TaxID=1883 RepID=UPI0024A1C757|nr:hypothetical protein [Streptomyces sp. NBRC 13847]GLW17703.1 hypothetical protein Stsp01_44460 [Streptomyces sp. NBRC 13847]